MIANLLLDLDNGSTSQPPGPNWLHVVGAVLVAAALLFAGPLRCTTPVTVPLREIPADNFAGATTTWSCPSQGRTAG